MVNIKILQYVARGGAPEVTVVATRKRGQIVQDICFVSWRLNHRTTEPQHSVVHLFGSQLTCGPLQQKRRSASAFDGTSELTI